MSEISEEASRPESVAGLDREEQEALDDIWSVWKAKLARNRKRERYYNAKNRLDNMGISIPPELERFGTVVGWPAKAVDSLANRSIFEGFGFRTKRNAELDSVLMDNNFDVLYQQAVESELINSCSFFTVTRGGPGEPAAIISCYSASDAAAVWDTRMKRVRYGFAITETEGGHPTEINLFMPDSVITIRRDGRVWAADKQPQKIERPLMEPLVYRPSVRRPFGRSRISRPVMELTDAAMRTSLRTEVSAEVFTLPQRYLLGVDDDFWDPIPEDDGEGGGDAAEPDQDGGGQERMPQATDLKRAKWDASFAAVFAVGLNSEGDKPTYGQLPQMSMEPHVAHFRQLAAQFAGETSVPISSLGVIHDNPASAEAIHAAKEDIVSEATKLNKTNGASLRNLGLMVLAVIQDRPIRELTEEERSIAVNWMNPATPSIVSQADAMAKLHSIAPWIAESDVLLEEMGFNDEQRRRMESDRRNYQGRTLRASLLSDAASAEGPSGSAG